MALAAVAASMAPGERELTPSEQMNTMGARRRRVRVAMAVIHAAALSVGINFDMTEAIRQLGPNAAMRIANEARVPANYLFNQFLPEINRPDYQAKSGTMTVRTTMAGLSGMDSPYPETGVIEISTFSEETAKVTNRVRLNERGIRQLQSFLQNVVNRGGDLLAAIQDEALNFVDKLIVQAHLDAFEWLRGRALMGSIDWTFNKIRLLVDYGIPSTNILAQRTGNNAYGGSTSMFWADVQTLRAKLKYNVRALVIHPELRDTIRNNTANNLAVTSDTPDAITFRKVSTVNGQFTQDVADVVNFVVYGAEGEIIDPANPGTTIKIPFMPRNTILAVGNDSGTRYIVGAGSTQPVENAIGYTHIGPTVEGGGAEGRWSDVYTPQGEPWCFEGRGVTNGLPVVESPDKIAIATTA